MSGSTSKNRPKFSFKKSYEKAKENNMELAKKESKCSTNVNNIIIANKSTTSGIKRKISNEKNEINCKKTKSENEVHQEEKKKMETNVIVSASYKFDIKKLKNNNSEHEEKGTETNTNGLIDSKLEKALSDHNFKREKPTRKEEEKFFAYFKLKPMCRKFMKPKKKDQASNHI
jgi:hypothetical protein